MKICFFTFPRLVHGGGFEKYIIELANALAARGHYVSTVTSSERQYRSLQRLLNLYYGNPIAHDNSRLSLSEVNAQFSGPTLFEVPLQRMGGLLQEHDVVYAKNEVLDLVILALLRARRLPPVICGVHTPMWYPRATSRPARLHNHLYLGGVYRRLLRNVDAVHVSNAHDRELFPQIHKVERKRVFHVPYPFDAIDEPNGATARRVDDRLRIVFAARLTEQKGVDVLLDVIANIEARGESREYAFTIAGSGEPEWEKSVVDAAGRHGNVRYVGHVESAEVSRLYADADVAFVPSSWETFPYACLEPQSQGLPVVASDIPGCQDIVSDGVTGFLFTVGDVEAATRALQHVRRLQVASPATLEEYGKRAADGVRRQSDRNTVVAALEQMFIDVADGARQ